MIRGRRTMRKQRVKSSTDFGSRVKKVSSSEKNAGMNFPRTACGRRECGIKLSEESVRSKNFSSHEIPSGSETISTTVCTNLEDQFSSRDRSKFQKKFQSFGRSLRERLQLATKHTRRTATKMKQFCRRRVVSRKGGKGHWCDLRECTSTLKNCDKPVCRKKRIYFDIRKKRKEKRSSEEIPQAEQNGVHEFKVVNLHEDEGTSTSDEKKISFTVCQNPPCEKTRRTFMMNFGFLKRIRKFQKRVKFKRQKKQRGERNSEIPRVVSEGRDNTCECSDSSGGPSRGSRRRRCYCLEED